jgi:hypothetical protein
MSKINILDAINEEVTNEVTAKATEMVNSGATTDPVQYDWAAVLPDDLRIQAEEWAKDVHPELGDAEISGFASDIMNEIKDQTKQILRNTAVRDLPEANAIFAALLEYLNKVDYNYKFNTPTSSSKSSVTFATGKTPCRLTSSRLRILMTSLKVWKLSSPAYHEVGQLSCQCSRNSRKNTRRWFFTCSPQPTPCNSLSYGEEGNLPI